MNTISNELVWCVDVDDTLVHGRISDAGASLEFHCPYTNTMLTQEPNYANIRLLKEKKARGAYIIVWSAGGNRWAREVVKTLGLEEYVDLVLTKPTGYCDDRQCSEWMGDRVYFKQGAVYK